MFDQKQEGIREPALTGKDQLRRKFDLAMESFGAAFIGEHLWGGFGARSIAYVNPGEIAAASERRQDQECFGEIFSRLNSVPPLGTVSCLEVGAGATYGISGGWSAPWFSRALAAIGHPALRLIASDLGSGLSWVAVDSSGAAYIGDFPRGRKKPLLSSLKFLPERRFEAEALSLKSALEYYGEGLKHSLAGYAGGIERRTDRLFVRPAVDAALESHLFGLDMRPRVNFYKLPALFPEEKFDFIFGRHLDGDAVLKNKQKLEASVRAALAPGGLALLGYEQTLHIGGTGWSDFGALSFRAQPLASTTRACPCANKMSAEQIRFDPAG